VDAEIKRRNVLRTDTLDCLPQLHFFLVGQPANAPIVLPCAADTCRGVLLNLFVFNSYPKSEADGGLPTVLRRRCPISISRSRYQPGNDLLFADFLGDTTAENRSERLEFKRQLLGRTFAVLGFGVFDGIIGQLAEGDQLRAEVLGQLLARPGLQRGHAAGEGLLNRINRGRSDAAFSDPAPVFAGGNAEAPPKDPIQVALIGKA